MIRRQFFGLICCLFFLTTTTMALADDSSAPGITLDLGFYNGDFLSQDDLTIVSPILHGGLPIGSGRSLTLDWGFTFVDFGDDDESRSEVGNPFVALHQSVDLVLIDVSAGFGVALPLANLPNGDDNQSSFTARALQSTSSARGLWNLWLWAPETLSLAVPMRAEIGLILFDLAGEFTPALLIPTGDEVDDQDNEFILQMAVDASMSAGLVRFGARLQAVWSPTGDDQSFIPDDEVQISIVPYATVSLGPVFVSGSATLNLTDPVGSSFDDDGIWMVSVSGGLSF